MSVKIVLGGGAWPIGQKVGFVALDLASALDAYRTWARGWLPPRPRFGPLPNAELAVLLQSLLPLEMPYTRRLLVAHGSDWTAIFDNSISGGDPYPPVAELARLGGARGVAAGHVPPEQSAYPVTQFHLLGSDGEYVRSIDCGIFDEGRWTFEAHGGAQPFEQPDAYGRRLVRERFTRSMLLEYLGALGIRADTPSAYGEAVLVRHRAVRVGRRLGLEEARADATGG